MPVIDGFETTRRIRSREQHGGGVPSIALTARLTHARDIR